MEFFYRFDLFSSQFYFNISGSQSRKATVLGTFLSLSIIAFISYYFAYLLEQYFNNQIQPSYTAQNYSNNQSIDLELTTDLIAFRFESNYNLGIDVLQAKQNTTYIVYYAYYVQMNQDNFDLIQLDIINCLNPNLDGFQCLDISKIPDKVLTSNNKDRILSQIQIFSYGCLDIDQQKTIVPDNCATQQQIDDVINAYNAGVKVLIKTSQFNVKSKQIEEGYRSTFIYTLSDQNILTTLKIQNQQTSVKQGFFIQEETKFASPLSYDLENQSLSRQSSIQLTNISACSQVNILADQMYQQIYIQYPTLPSVLSWVNSIFQLLLFSGILIRTLSQSSIKKDLLVLLLQNVYQQTYLKILKANKILFKNDNQQSTSQIQNQQDDKEQEIAEENDFQQDKSSNLMPQINFKIKQKLDSKIQIQKKQICKLDTQEQSKQEDDQSNIFISQKYQSDGNQQPFDQSKLIQENKKLRSKFHNMQQLQPDKNQDIFPSQILDQPFKNSILSQNDQATQKSIINSFDKSPQQQSKKRQKSNLKNFEDQINTQSNVNNIQINKYLQHFRTIKNMIFQKQVNTIISKTVNFRCCKRKKEEQAQESNFVQNQENTIQKQINKDLNILELYKDIIQLKKAVMILLNKDQFAALGLIGCSSSFLSLKLNQLQKNYDDYQLESHYEQLNAISISNQLQEKYIQQFFQRCLINQNLNEIDQRILSSINNLID
ncbi:AMP-binding enzyme family protein (macronuclear) [Tetrahymena thermophila SB210]|uniref:AMP-binding enzyme family protein n=1 Tax=Tetrahymena thermophila (strain SB210) TaxID=312017 RepID=Q245Z8_TETTS|nr:AMP-binding enzyme family protein [Tetrahymena thermophila SB210]EAS03485.3 AMP-binding enzyme family protein [Tetrahymena thermophila SB210]|eukprot:XP_001023730.3 AMP-binding enzyme family protein [Tetrahymena thermophila SB210]